MNKNVIIFFLLSLLVISMYFVIRKEVAIREYQAFMEKKEYSPCSFVDEEAGIMTSWDENDTELQGFSRDEKTGEYLPIKDYMGRVIKEPPARFSGEIKSMHIPFIRGFRWQDKYGVSSCNPCRDAKDEGAKKICNDKYGYTKLENVPEDLDKILYVEEKTNSY